MFCGMRRDNHALPRFVLTVEDIVVAAEKMCDAGIRTIFLQAGEFPQSTSLVTKALERILNRLPLSAILCLGNKTRDDYKRLRDAGADRYIIKQETSDPALYAELKEESLTERLRCLEWLLDLSYRVGLGNVIGLPGQTIDSIVEDIQFVRKYGAHMASASPFIPNDQTPLAGARHGDTNMTLNVLATLRQVLPDAEVPAVSALQTAHADGQYLGLQAGANVLTVNYTPEVHRKQYLLYKTDRYIVGLDHAQEVIARANLTNDLFVTA